MRYIMDELSEKIKNELMVIKAGTNVKITRDQEVLSDDNDIVIYCFCDKKDDYDDVAIDLFDIVNNHDKKLIARVYIYDGETTHHYADPRILERHLN